MKNMNYDMHIATEAGDSAALKKAFSELGFKDDRLAERHLTFDAETGRHYSACPLIDVHVSKKIETRPELRELEIEIHGLMKDSGLVGYWHSEYVMADEHIEPVNPFVLRPLPFARFMSRPRAEEKVWDIHLAFRESLMPPGLGELLLENGIYYIARLKKVPEGGEERFAVYTVQGVNRTKEGERLYLELCKWLKAVGVPPCDIKLELTTAMKVYNSPQLVPPTVDSIQWV